MTDYKYSDEISESLFSIFFHHIENVPSCVVDFVAYNSARLEEIIKQWLTWTDPLFQIQACWIENELAQLVFI